MDLPEAFVVHRGVSQGGKKLTAEKRKAFWQKNSQKVAGIEAGDGKIILSLQGFRALREESLVIVSNPGKPRVWTIKRIMGSAEKVSMMNIGELLPRPKIQEQKEPDQKKLEDPNQLQGLGALFG